MTDNTDSRTPRSPRRLALRELNQRAGRNRGRDAAGKLQNKLAQPQNRWQRFARYVWDKKRG
jgi:hypothetical protein